MTTTEQGAKWSGAGSGTVPATVPTIPGEPVGKPNRVTMHTQPVVRFWHPGMGIGRHTHATILRELAHKPVPRGWAFGPGQPTCPR